MQTGGHNKHTQTYNSTAKCASYSSAVSTTSVNSFVRRDPIDNEFTAEIS
jgi:hypothetical protein